MRTRFPCNLPRLGAFVTLLLAIGATSLEAHGIGPRTPPAPSVLWSAPIPRALAVVAVWLLAAFSIEILGACLCTRPMRSGFRVVRASFLWAGLDIAVLVTAVLIADMAAEGARILAWLVRLVGVFAGLYLAMNVATAIAVVRHARRHPQRESDRSDRPWTRMALGRAIVTGLFLPAVVVLTPLVVWVAGPRGSGEDRPLSLKTLYQDRIPDLLTCSHCDLSGLLMSNRRSRRVPGKGVFV